jgi:hypothetical protein
MGPQHFIMVRIMLAVLSVDCALDLDSAFTL